MAKTALQKAIERQTKESQKEARAVARRETAQSVVNGAEFVAGFRVMDEESETLLREILSQYDGNEKNHVNFSTANLPRYIRETASLGYEKLKQYGMISTPATWGNGAIITLSESGKKYFEKKQAAYEKAEVLNKSAEEQEVGQVKTNGENRKVFIVHGHDDGAKEKVARFVEHIDYEPIILHEQANGGRTIIEKIEHYTDVVYAIVLYTPCDLGHDKNVQEEKYRARQNVVFEHGYLMGKLGRDKVCALVVGDVETPGDIDGVVYEPMDKAGAWERDIAKEMISAGLEVDASKLL